MKNSIDYNEIIAENARRNEALISHYDPITGAGCYGNREECTIGGITYHLPEEMLRNHEISNFTPIDQLERIRINMILSFGAHVA